MTVPDALRALLRATAPGEASLPACEQLAAVRPGAVAALHRAFQSGLVDPLGTLPRDRAAVALMDMLDATMGDRPDFARLISARMAAQDALAAAGPPTRLDLARAEYLAALAAQDDTPGA